MYRSITPNTMEEETPLYSTTSIALTSPEPQLTQFLLEEEPLLLSLYLSTLSPLRTKEYDKIVGLEGRSL